LFSILYGFISASFAQEIHTFNVLFHKFRFISKLLIDIFAAYFKIFNRVL
jgi:hypothetical protein